MRKFTVVGILSAIGVIAVGMASNSALVSVVSLGIVMAGLEILVITRLAGGFSPVIIPIAAVSSSLLMGALLWGRVQADARVSIQLPAVEEGLVQAATVAVIFCLAYTIGACLAGPRKMVAMPLARLRESVKMPDGLLVFVGYSGIFFAIYAWQGALIQATYLQANGPFWAVAVATPVIPAAVLALSIVTARTSMWRWAAVIGIVLICLILFARASRNLALLPVLILLGRTFATGGGFRTKSVMATAIMTVVMFQIPLIGRSNPSGVGLVPLAEQLISRPEELVNGFTVGALLGNFLVTAPLTYEVANRPIEFHIFWVSLNPLPGGLAGWDDIRQSMKVNRFTPYNALGELAAYGWTTLVTVALLVGFVLALATRIASHLKGRYQAPASLLVLASTAYFSLSILQYNLRSGFRLIWYLAAGLIVISLISGLFPSERDADSIEIRQRKKILPRSTL